MKKQQLKAVMASTVLAAGVLSMNTSNAASIDQVLAKGQTKAKAAKKSQQKIDKLAGQTTELLAKYKVVLDQIDDLELYNSMQEERVKRREQELKNIEASIGQIDTIKQGIDPLVVDMLDSLEQFIGLDMPFNVTNRLEQVEDIRARDIKVAEKFRQVLEAYSIESEYGRKISLYDTTLEVGGEERPVNLLAVGRIALIYQTPDTQYTGAWDKTAKAWVELDSSYRTSVQKAIKIAKNQAVVDIVELPIAAPEAAK